MLCHAARLTVSLALLSTTVPGLAAPIKHPAKPPVHAVKGQGQMAGGDGEFGTVYSLKNGFNFAILSAHYTVEPFQAYASQIPGPNEKVVVLDIAIKNAFPKDNYFSPSDLFTLEDDKGQLYTGGQVALTSSGTKEGNASLRPGQGLGQTAMHDPLRYGVVVPAKARIVKIMVNKGLLNSSESVVRYYVAGATAAEAGKAGDPQNVIDALPDGVKDPSDPSGAVALDSGKGTMGVFLPSGFFALRLDSVTYTSDPILNGHAPGSGKQFAVATVTAKNLIDKSNSMFTVTGGDNTLDVLTDSDGEADAPAGFEKGKLPERAEHDFKLGDEYTFRIVFPLSKTATAKTLVLGTSRSRTWTFDVPSGG